MTLETCKKRLEIAKERGDEEQVKFWENRIARKILKFPKYAHLKEETKSKGKK